jgi:auxin efflux carrier family protein
VLFAGRFPDNLIRVSIAVISTLVAKTDLLGDDPLLWFTMMLMPTGPSAMKLTALAEATHAEDEEKMAITKFLSVCDLSILPGGLG